MAQQHLGSQILGVLTRYFSVKQPPIVSDEVIQLASNKATSAAQRSVAAGEALIAELNTLDSMIRGANGKGVLR